MSTNREENIRLGLLAVASGQMSIYQAAQTYNLPESTLRYRMKNNNTSRQESREPLKLLNKQQESDLAEWCLEQFHNGTPVTHKDLRIKVRASVNQKGNYTAKVGRDWVKGFLKRNKNVAAGNRNKIVPAGVTIPKEPVRSIPKEGSSSVDTEQVPLPEIQRSEGDSNSDYRDVDKLTEYDSNRIPIVLRPMTTLDVLDNMIESNVVTNSSASKSEYTGTFLPEETKDRFIQGFQEYLSSLETMTRILNMRNPSHQQIVSEMRGHGAKFVVSSLKNLQNIQKCHMLEKEVADLKKQLDQLKSQQNQVD